MTATNETLSMATEAQLKRDLPQSIVIPPIRGEMVHLRPATVEDLPRLDELDAFYGASKITGKDAVTERAIVHTWVRRSQAWEAGQAPAESGVGDPESRRTIAWAVLTDADHDEDGEIDAQSTDNVIGMIFLIDIDGWSRSARIQVVLGRDYRGRGYSRDLMPRVMTYGFAPEPAGLGMHRIWVSVPEKNSRSISVYQSLGFVPSGTSRDALWDAENNKYQDLIVMDTLADEYDPIRSLDAFGMHLIEDNPGVKEALSAREHSIAIQQMIAIARAVDMKCQVLILDEPTSSLDDDEVEKLFVLMRRLRDEGVGIIFVTHFLEQVYAVCDRITVLRNGELVGEYETKDLPRVMLVAKMMGKDFDDLADIKGDHKDKRITDAEPVIEAKGLSHKGTIKPFDITINKGEVIGLTGLLGSGRSELVRAIYGADKADTGTLKVKGKEVKINTPLDAMKLGMAYLPEDRKAEGIIADLSVRENIIIALQAKRGMFHPLSKKEMEDAADKYIKLLQIKTASRETPIKSLSGGNQQKVILGRWLLTNPDYLILDEPTRGIDIGTKTEIQKLVLDLADQGMAVTFISSEVEEMLRTCSRMAVLRDGQKVGELEEDELSQSGVMKAIAGGDDK